MMNTYEVKITNAENFSVSDLASTAEITVASYTVVREKGCRAIAIPYSVTMTNTCEYPIPMRMDFYFMDRTSLPDDYESQSEDIDDLSLRPEVSSMLSTSKGSVAPGDQIEISGVIRLDNFYADGGGVGECLLNDPDRPYFEVGAQIGYGTQESILQRVFMVKHDKEVITLSINPDLHDM